MQTDRSETAQTLSQADEGLPVSRPNGLFPRAGLLSQLDTYVNHYLFGLKTPISILFSL